MRLGDIDAVKDKLLHDSFCSRHDFNTVMHALDEAPTVDALPVVHGRWIDAIIPNDDKNLPIIVCDQCNTFFPLAFGDSHRYCPQCGAKMDGEKVSE